MLVKSPCPCCFNNIEFPAEAVGALIFCPHCERQIALSAPAKKKPVDTPPENQERKQHRVMECFSCHAEVQFEAEDTGIRARCPSCGEWLKLRARDAGPMRVREQDKAKKLNEGDVQFGCFVMAVLGIGALFALRWLYQFLTR